ncbi:hypothetical protein N5J30_25390, partial [Klebsiella michiganensis]|uniref:hypothetical protein n=1 Tax=Klebsiella michiganensis TaxID=1134687 RepID=UPI00244BDF99
TGYFGDAWREAPSPLLIDRTGSSGLLAGGFFSADFMRFVTKSARLRSFMALWFLPSLSQ